MEDVSHHFLSIILQILRCTDVTTHWDHGYGLDTIPWVQLWLLNGRAAAGAKHNSFMFHHFTINQGHAHSSSNDLAALTTFANLQLQEQLRMLARIAHFLGAVDLTRKVAQAISPRHTVSSAINSGAIQI